MIDKDRAEIRKLLLSCELQRDRFAIDQLLLRFEQRIVLGCERRQLRKAVLQRAPADFAESAQGRVEGLVGQGIEQGFRGLPAALEDLEALLDLRDLDLRVEDVLLDSLSDGIPGRGDARQPIEEVALLRDDAGRLLDAVEVVEGRFHFARDPQARELEARLFGLGLQLGDLLPQRAFAGKRELLGEPDVDLAETIRAERLKRNGISFVHLAEHQLRIGESACRRDLRSEHVDRAPRSGELRAALERQPHEISQRDVGSLGLSERQRDAPDGGDQS